MSSRTRVAAAAMVLAGVCLGYGGFGAGLAFPDFEGLNWRLSELNREWKGTGGFGYAAPFWTIGGHGGSEVGPATLGGWGEATVLQDQADSLGSMMAAILGGFEAGYPYAPVEQFQVRPCLDLALGAWFVDAHSLEDGGSNFYRWFLGWQLAAAPGVEVMGRIRTTSTTYAGLFVKASYVLPFMATQWSGSAGRPDFGLQGFSLKFGLRFGKLELKPFRV